MDVWQSLLGQIRRKVSKKTFETWFRPTSLLEQAGDTVVVSVPHLLFREWITSNYLPLIQETLLEMGLAETEVSFREAGASGGTPSGNGSQDVRPPSGGGNGKTNGRSRMPLATRFTFNNFVVGPSNQFAYAACRAVAEGPSNTYNPLYIHGGVGLGKTHLMQAVGNQICHRRGNIRVAYLSAERFMNEMIAAIRFKRSQDFRERYRSMDVLLIDDIQFIEGKEGTQEEFFHTFNHLYEAQKQIVITSDCPPKDISTLEERLRSRFEWGLLADIQPPEVETKVAILRKKAEAAGVELDDDVALFIASRVKSNIRELEGCLTKVCAYASLIGKPTDRATAEECLRDIIDTEEMPLTVERIQSAVAGHFKMKVSALKSRTNVRTITRPRQIAMYLCRNLLDVSYPELGKAFGGKHHSTVIHSVRKVGSDMDKDKEFHRLVHTLRDDLVVPKA